MKAFDPSIVPEDTFCSESRIGPTPSGGAYSVAHYSDKFNHPCRKEDACWVHIAEYDSQGKWLNDVIGMCGRPENRIINDEERKYISAIHQAYNAMCEGKSLRLTLRQLELPQMSAGELRNEHYKYVWVK